MKPILCALTMLLVLLVGCTRDPNAAESVQVPTLAVLSTEIVATSTLVPSAEPPTEKPPTVTPTITLSPIPTETQPPTPTVAPPTAIPPTVNPNSWLITTAVSPLDDITSIGLGIGAESPVHAWLNDVTPILFVRCRAGVVDVLISIDTTFDSATEIDDTAYVAIRWDKEKSNISPMDETSKRDGVIFTDPVGTLKLIASHQTLVFGFQPFNSNETAATFQLAGFREAAQPLLAACNISGI